MLERYVEVADLPVAFRHPAVLELLGTVPITQLQRDALRDLRARRWTNADIAALLGVNARTLRKWQAEERRRTDEVRANCLAVADYLDRA